MSTRGQLLYQVVAVEDYQNERRHEHNQRLKAKVRVHMRAQLVQDLIDVHGALNDVHYCVRRWTATVHIASTANDGVMLPLLWMTRMRRRWFSEVANVTSQIDH